MAHLPRSLDKKAADVLQKVRVQVFDNSECHQAYYPRFKIGIRSWHLCAGTQEGGKGTCHVSFLILLSLSRVKQLIVFVDL